MSSSPYSPAARLLTQIWTTHKSLKTLAYDPKKGNLRISKATYAQVCHVLENKALLDKVRNTVLEGLSCRNEGLLYILLYEILLGPNQAIRGGGALKRQLLKKEQALRDALEGLQSQSTESQTSAATFPRYVRVNTLLTTASDVVDALKKSHPTICCDRHVPDLLVLPPGSRVDPALEKAGHVILQDKSSCFSALCLVRGNDVPLHQDASFLDACAAPGNKTSHVAALVEHPSSNEAVVIALDRSSNRLASLRRRMQQLIRPASWVATQHQDFLQTQPTNYPSVRGILLDPSCSGSGIFSIDRMQQQQQEGNNDRLQHLSNFQVTALKHAMSFPKVERLVYSTCSVHEQENEQVVRQGLEAFHDQWEVVAPACLRHWERRGRTIEGLTSEQSKCLIRADRDDATNGFFVAYFERKGSKRRRVKDNTSPLPQPIHGLSFYDGAFSNRTKANIEQPSPDNSKPNDSMTPESDAKINKKRAKKLAWKRKQLKQKKARLLKKTQTESS